MFLSSVHHNIHHFAELWEIFYTFMICIIICWICNICMYSFCCCWYWVLFVYLFCIVSVSVHYNVYHFALHWVLSLRDILCFYCLCYYLQTIYICIASFCCGLYRVCCSCIFSVLFLSSVYHNFITLHSIHLIHWEIFCVFIIHILICCILIIEWIHFVEVDVVRVSLLHFRVFAPTTTKWGHTTIYIQYLIKIQTSS